MGFDGWLQFIIQKPPRKNLFISGHFVTASYAIDIRATLLLFTTVSHLLQSIAPISTNKD
jgi:hypothetical protein